jgi:hypothetical protein
LKKGGDAIAQDCKQQSIYFHMLKKTNLYTKIRAFNNCQYAMDGTNILFKTNLIHCIRTLVHCTKKRAFLPLVSKLDIYVYV